MKTDVTAIGNVDLPDTLAGTGIKHLHLVRAVDNGIEPRAIDLKVIAHIAQFLGHIGISLGVDITAVNGGGIVVIVECRLVGAHIPLVEQIERGNGGMLGFTFLFLFVRNDGYILTARSQDNE